METEKNVNFPMEIKDVEPQLAEELMKHFTEGLGFVLAGPKKYFLTHRYREEASNIYNMPLREGDVFVVSYPRSGTTWTQELVWMVANDLDYKTASVIPLTKRYPLLEVPVFTPSDNLDSKDKPELPEIATVPGTKILAVTPSPRFIKTHLPLSLLPPKLLDTAKVVYVARDPRDVAVSFYHLHSSMKVYVGDLRTYWNYFIKDSVYWSPYFEHLKEGWEKRHHPNLLFLFYEELSKDLPAVVRRVAAFFNKRLNEEQVTKLCDHLSINNFKKNTSINNGIKEMGYDVNPESFIRKGKAGGWRDYFDADMTREADDWMAENLKDTDFRFPHLAP